MEATNASYTEQVRQATQRLEECQKTLRTQATSNIDIRHKCYTRMVTEYYNVFENGFCPGVPSAVGSDAAQFVERMMDPKVAIGRRYAGCSVVMDQWERYTKAFGGFECQLLSSRIESTDNWTIVRASSHYAFQITRDTMAAVFPDTLHQNSRLLAILVGTPIQGAAEATFTFDHASQRVVRLELELDFMDVLARLLSPNEASQLFQSANISEEFLIGNLSNYPLQQE